MKQGYRKFWFEFEIPSAFEYPPGIGIGCGITAIDYIDALNIMDEKIFIGKKRPPFKTVVENVEIGTLDQGHVIPNMRSSVHRGIWFPIGYE